MKNEYLENMYNNILDCQIMQYEYKKGRIKTYTDFSYNTGEIICINSYINTKKQNSNVIILNQYFNNIIDLSDFIITLCKADIKDFIVTFSNNENNDNSLFMQNLHWFCLYCELGEQVVFSDNLRGIKIHI